MLARLTIALLGAICAVPGGFAQVSPAAARSDCPIESHPAAINPDVIACHAAFAPLPAIPSSFDDTDPRQLEHLRAQGDALIHQLNRPDACGKDAKLQRFESCAILVYVLDEEFRQMSLPWTYIVRIYRMKIPGDDGVRNSVLLTVNSNNSEGEFGPGTDEVWQLLAERRATTRCRHVSGQNVGTGISSSGMKPDQCRSTGGDDVRYRPALLIGRGEAARVFNKAAIERHFKAEAVVKQCSAAGYAGKPSDC